MNGVVFLKDGSLVAVNETGEVAPIELDIVAPTVEPVSTFSPVFHNAVGMVGWRLRNATEKPVLGSGRLIANYIKIGTLLKLQVCLVSGPDTIIPTDDGFLFPLYSALTPSKWALAENLGGFGPVFMNSRDDGVMAGSYTGACKLVVKKIDNVETPCVAVYYPDGSPLSHLTPISAIKPFNWRSAEEGGNWLSFELEYEVPAA